MELKISDIEGNAYQNFKDSIRDKETFRKYNSYLKYFLELIPNEMYKQYLGSEPLSRDIEVLASAFTEIAHKNVKSAKDIIKAYVRNLKEEINQKKLSAGTARNRLKPLKALMKSNEVEMSWYLVDKSLPKPGKSKDRAYSKTEIQDMMKKATDLTDKVIITCYASGGFRVEAWNYFTWDDLVFFCNDDETFKGGALRVYRGDIEEYWCFITPEACNYLSLYRKEWKARFFKYPKKTDPLLVSLRHGKPMRLKSGGVKSRTENFVGAIGIRPKLEDGKKRHEVMLDHGFRKFNNTMMRRAKVDFADKEDLQGRNPGGQEESYERYEEEDFERFPEYQKAIPFLTIDDAESERQEKEKLRRERDILLKDKEIMNSIKDEVQYMREEQDRLRQAAENTKLELDELKKKS